MGAAGSLPRDNDHLVDELVFESSIKTKRNEAAFRLVDRKRFFPQSGKSSAYLLQAWKASEEDEIKIHISAPGVYAIALEALKIKKGLSFLNIGSGTGYFSTVAGFLLGANGVNHGIECREKITEYSIDRASQTLDTKEVNIFDWCRPVFITGNAFDIDDNTPNRYDRIYVGAKVPDSRKLFFPKLLKIDGICVMPYRNGLFKVTKKTEKCFEFRFIARVSFADLFANNDSNEKKEPLVLPPIEIPTLACSAVISARRRLREKIFENYKIRMVLKTLKKEENKPNRFRTLMRDHVRRDEMERRENVARLHGQRNGDRNPQNPPPIPRAPNAPNENVLINLDDNGMAIDDPFEERDDERRGEGLDFLEVFGDIDFNIRFRSPTPDPRPGQGGPPTVSDGTNSSSANSSSPISEYSEDDRTQSQSDIEETEDKMDQSNDINKKSTDKKKDLEDEKDNNEKKSDRHLLDLGLFSDYDDDDDDGNDNNHGPPRGGNRIRVEAAMVTDLDIEDRRSRAFRHIALQERQNIEERFNERGRYYENRNRQREGLNLPRRYAQLPQGSFVPSFIHQDIYNTDRARSMRETINDIQRQALSQMDQLLGHQLINDRLRERERVAARLEGLNSMTVQRGTVNVAPRNGIESSEYNRRARNQRRLRRCMNSFQQRSRYFRTYNGNFGSSNNNEDGNFADAEDVGDSSSSFTIPRSYAEMMSIHQSDDDESSRVAQLAMIDEINREFNDSDIGSIDFMETLDNDALFEDDESSSQRSSRIDSFSNALFPPSIMVDELDQEYGAQVVRIREDPENSEITVDVRTFELSSSSDDNSSSDEPDAKKSKSDKKCPCKCECHTSKTSSPDEEKNEDDKKDKSKLRKRKRNKGEVSPKKKNECSTKSKGKDSPPAKKTADDGNTKESNDSTGGQSANTQSSSLRSGGSIFTRFQNAEFLRNQTTEQFNERVELARRRLRARIAAATQTSPSHESSGGRADAETNTDSTLPNPRERYEQGYLDFEESYFNTRGWESIPITDPIRDTVTIDNDGVVVVSPRYINVPEVSRNTHPQGPRSVIRRRMHAVDEEMNRRLQQMQRNIRRPFGIRRTELDDESRELSEEERLRFEEVRTQRESITEFSNQYKEIITKLGLSKNMTSDLLYL
uniref:Protein-L-isoaspartate O-methyltransferase domain-containing protein 1 n=1 Tax=Parastrongyloides trichosuri TaxID=131310 RepID=A0A0N4ZNP7_PARTI